MSEMVERVALALYRQVTGDTEDSATGSWPGCGDKIQSDYRAMARAAIKTMREPTEAMLEVGPVEPYMDRDVWAMMIDEALK